MRTEAQKRSAENLKQYQFKPGESGNPDGRRRQRALPKAYQQQLSAIEPTTGKSYAECIATLIVQAATTGDVHALMVAVSNDSKGLVQKAVASLIEETGCNQVQARLAMSLFMPEVIING